MTRSEIEPQSLGPLANTLPTRPMSRYIVGIRYSFFFAATWVVFSFRNISCVMVWLLLNGTPTFIVNNTRPSQKTGVVLFSP